MSAALDTFFRPRSVALVGATDKSAWSRLIHANFGAMGYTGDVWLVNKRGTPAHGQPAVTSCRDLPAIPDIAYIFVPTEAVDDANPIQGRCQRRHVQGQAASLVLLRLGNDRRRQEADQQHHGGGANGQPGSAGDPGTPGVNSN